VPSSPLDLTRVTTLTFDCYGTLIDWEAGVIDVLRPLLMLWTAPPPAHRCHGWGRC
jgi:FMN phosphatase YigB (HAD superfamily)